MRPIIAAALSMLVLVSTLMTGCSGGGGGAGAGAAPAAANMVTGVAATGAAINGTVYLTDASVPRKNLVTRTASDGSYAFNIDGLKPPYIIKTAYIDINGIRNLYSLASEAGITNITPLTTIVVAQAISGTNLDAFYTNHTSADLEAAAAKMPAALKDLQNALEPLMAQYGVKGFDVLHGSFAVGQAGIDTMMDAITVAVATDGAITINTKKGNTPVFAAQVKNLAAGALTMPPDLAPMPTPSAGSQLYSSNCARCHGNIASSNLIGRVSAATAQSAITSNLGGMASLAGISAADLQSITEALAATVPASTPATSTPAVPAGPAGTNKPDGAALYAANCAGCHGALASSRKTGATITRTQNAISGNVGGMGSLASLTAADIQAIVTALNPAGSTPAPVPAPPSTSAPTPGTTPAPTPAPVINGATEYSNSCAGCHQPLATSTKQGVTATRLDNAISGNIGGMGFLSSLTAAIRQAIVVVLNPGSTVPAPTPAPAPVPVPVPTPAPVPGPAPDGAALYAANCAGCHGTLGTSSKKGITIARLQSAINNNIGGMGPLSRLTVTDVQAIVTALTPATPTPVPTPTPAPVPNPTPTPALDGAALYSANCAGCHGPLATSGKTGATVARIQNAISGNIGNMGYLKTLTTAQVTAISTSLAPVVTPTPTPAPVPNPTPTPAPDGAALYTSNCAGCHGPLATSGKAGATAARIQAAITGNTGNMGYLSTLSSSQVTAIASALATVTPAPNPAPACGSCHAIPPSSGHHSTHVSQKVACATCHGTGYSTTTVNAATHNNGVKNIVTTIGWNSTSRSCSNSCHGKQTW